MSGRSRGFGKARGGRGRRNSPYYPPHDYGAQEGRQDNYWAHYPQQGGHQDGARHAAPFRERRDNARPAPSARGKTQGNGAASCAASDQPQARKEAAKPSPAKAPPPGPGSGSAQASAKTQEPQDTTYASLLRDASGPPSKMPPVSSGPADRSPGGLVVPELSRKMSASDRVSQPAFPDVPMTFDQAFLEVSKAVYEHFHQLPRKSDKNVALPEESWPNLSATQATTTAQSETTTATSQVTSKAPAAPSVPVSHKPRLPPQSQAANGGTSSHAPVQAQGGGHRQTPTTIVQPLMSTDPVVQAKKSTSGRTATTNPQSAQPSGRVRTATTNPQAPTPTCPPVQAQASASVRTPTTNPQAPTPTCPPVQAQAKDSGQTPPGPQPASLLPTPQEAPASAEAADAAVGAPDDVVPDEEALHSAHAHVQVQSSLGAREIQVYSQPIMSTHPQSVPPLQSCAPAPGQNLPLPVLPPPVVQAPTAAQVYQQPQGTQFQVYPQPQSYQPPANVPQPQTYPSQPIPQYQSFPQTQGYAQVYSYPDAQDCARPQVYAPLSSQVYPQTQAFPQAQGASQAQVYSTPQVYPQNYPQAQGFSQPLAPEQQVYPQSQGVPKAFDPSFKCDPNMYYPHLDPKNPEYYAYWSQVRSQLPNSTGYQNPDGKQDAAIMQPVADYQASNVNLPEQEVGRQRLPVERDASGQRVQQAAQSSFLSAASAAAAYPGTPYQVQPAEAHAFWDNSMRFQNPQSAQGQTFRHQFPDGSRGGGFRPRRGRRG